jgi:hypothetical protein
MITTPTVGTHVFSTQDYEVRVASVTDAETKEAIFVYGLYNTATGVREAELRALTTAMVWCTKVQSDLNDQRKAEEQAAAIVAAMPEPCGEEDVHMGDPVEVLPVISEAEMKAMLDGD